MQRRMGSTPILCVWHNVLIDTMLSSWRKRKRKRRRRHRRRHKRWRSCEWTFTDHKRSCGKVMFLHQSVILSTGGGGVSVFLHLSVILFKEGSLSGRVYQGDPPPVRLRAGGTHPTGMHSCSSCFPAKETFQSDFGMCSRFMARFSWEAKQIDVTVGLLSVWRGWLGGSLSECVKWLVRHIMRVNSQ